MGWLERVGVAAAIAVWSIGAGVPILSRYRALHIPNGLDQGYFLQRVWQAASLDEPVRTLLNTEQGHGLIVARHFEPILALFVPGIGLWPDHRVLLMGQLALLGLSLPFVWRLARCHLPPHQAMLATWCWLGMPVLWQMEAMGFRTMALATPFVAGCLWAASTGRTLWTLLLGLAALSCREEVVWALLASLPWLYHWRGRHWRGRHWRDTPVVLSALCVAWLVLLALVHGGPSTFWQLSELPGNLLDRFQNVEGANHTSWSGAALFLGRWLGPGALAALLAPLAALPLMVWWIGIQAASGLAGPEAVHLFGPIVGLLALVTPLGVSRLPARWITPALVLLLAAGGVRWSQDVLPEWVTWAKDSPSPSGDVWTLVAHVPREAAVLTEARLLPAVAARSRVYATEDWSDPAVLDGYYGLALLRKGHPWETHLTETGFKIRRVGPDLALWASADPLSLSAEPRTPQ